MRYLKNQKEWEKYLLERLRERPPPPKVSLPTVLRRYDFMTMTVEDVIDLARKLHEEKEEKVEKISEEKRRKLKVKFIEKVRPLNTAEWKSKIEENFPQAVFEAEACASVIAQLLIEDIGNPFGLVLMGPPSSLKTTVLNFFTAYRECIKLDAFSPASFVSHIKVKKKKLAEIDLLPQIKDKALIVPDLTPVFGMRKEDLLKNISLLTRVFDGEGLVTASGVHGVRGYIGPYNFMMLAASVPMPPRVWKIMGILGARLYFLNMRATGKEIQDYIQQLSDTAYKEKVRKCQDATDRFLTWLFGIKYPDIFHQEPKLEWNRKEDPRPVLEIIVKLAILLAKLRGIVGVAIRESEDEYGEPRETIHYSLPIIENPDRAILMLYNLARGHALICERTQLSYADIPLIIEVALSSAPYERVKLIRYLIEKGGTASSLDMRKDLNISKSTAHRTMKTLQILGLVNIEKERIETESGTQKVHIMTLRKEFRWLQEPEFQKLWHGEIPLET